MVTAWGRWDANTRNVSSCTAAPSLTSSNLTPSKWCLAAELSLPWKREETRGEIQQLLAIAKGILWVTPWKLARGEENINQRWQPPEHHSQSTACNLSVRSGRKGARIDADSLSASRCYTSEGVSLFACRRGTGQVQRQSKHRGRAALPSAPAAAGWAGLGWAVHAGSPRPKGAGVQVTVCIERTSTSKCCTCWLPISIASCIRNKGLEIANKTPRNCDRWSKRWLHWNIPLIFVNSFILDKLKFHKVQKEEFSFTVDAVWIPTFNYLPSKSCALDSVVSPCAIPGRAHTMQKGNI